MSFRRYELYKDSGDDWLGQIPDHWSISRLCHIATINDDTLGEDTDPDRLLLYVDIGSIDTQTGKLTLEAMLFKDAPSRARRLVRDGDVIISTVRTYLRAIAPIRSPDPSTVVSTGFAVVRAGTVLRPRFATYALLAETLMAHVIARSTGVSYPSITAKDLGLMKIPHPLGIKEQNCIAAFLDRETAKIDALIDEQQRLIELLKEKRQAVISQAVTKGLDPAAPMKDSGVRWIGQIPSSWDVIRSRRLFRLRNEPARDSDRQLTASQKHGMIFQSEFIELEGRRVVEVIQGTDSLRHAEPNDFIISLRSFQGGLEWCKVAGAVTFHYVILIPATGVHPPFFSYLFKSASYIQALRSTANLIRDGQDLRYSHFVLVDLPLVPWDQQVRIAAFLNSETAKIDQLASEAQSAIALLQERRGALISAAVTGKIDVRNYTPRETTPALHELSHTA